MKIRRPKWIRFIGLGVALFVLPRPEILGQDKNAGTVEGRVYDSDGSPLKDASVSLESSVGTQKFVTRSDEQGKFRFEIVPAGKYTVSAKKAGYWAKTDGPVSLERSQVKTIEFHLNPETAGATGTSSTVQFSDEPQFQIAGIADPTNYGGHGSDTVLRTKERLAQDTVSLNHEPSNASSSDVVSGRNSGATESALHRHRGDVDEKEGKPLDAVHEYQVAAEFEPSEPNLFAWGAELLLHRAYEPAIEVFLKGQKTFPHSTRMLLGLGIATYDQGAAERGEQLVLEACDLNPADPEPYLFLGTLQEAEKIAPPEWAEKFQRFVKLHPENAMAHYYFAVALSRQRAEAKDFALVLSELQQAVKLDPKLGNAYLQLGELYAQRREFPLAISAFQEAIKNLPLPDEAHYRLAQVYRQTGEPEKAEQQIKLYNQTSEERTKLAEQQRHEIQQFIYRLQGQKPDSNASDPKP